MEPELVEWMHNPVTRERLGPLLAERDRLHNLILDINVETIPETQLRLLLARYKSYNNIRTCLTQTPKPKQQK